MKSQMDYFNLGCTYLLIQCMLAFACKGCEVATVSTLLQVVKGPVTKYFPPNCERVGFSHSSDTLVTLRHFVDTLPDTTPAVFVVGAMSHGKINVTYVDQMISISEYPLSAACCLGRITNSFENKWDIV